MTQQNNNAVVVANNNAPANVQQPTMNAYSPRTYAELMDFATRISQTSFVPTGMQGKPNDVFVAMQLGSEVGLPLMQSLQNIAVINGRPCIWGDAMIALVRNSPLCEYINETVENGVATCKVKRKGEPEYISTFTEAQAKQAGLWGKVGPWKLYPERMLKMRARGFALRDVFADVLRGLQSAEEQQDTLYHKQHPNGDAQIQQMPEEDISATTKRDIPENEFISCLIKMRSAIDAGQRTAEQCLENVSKNYLLTDEQKAAILGLAELKQGAKPQTYDEYLAWIKLGIVGEEPTNVPEDF